MSGHEHIYELISLKLDGALDAAGQRELDEHLAVCDDCRETYELLLGARKALDAEPEPPEELLAGVMRGVERINRSRRNARASRIGISVGFLAAAAAVALAVLPKGADRAGNTTSADDGIAAYSLDGPEARDAVVDSGQTVGLFPGEVAIPIDDGQVEIAREGCRAVAYFEDIPDEIVENGRERVLSTGETCYEITGELFDKYSDQAVMIEYPNQDGESLVAVTASQGS